jgi:hypothetical protein
MVCEALIKNTWYSFQSFFSTVCNEQTVIAFYKTLSVLKLRIRKKISLGLEISRYIFVPKYGIPFKLICSFRCRSRVAFYLQKKDWQLDQYVSLVIHHALCSSHAIIVVIQDMFWQANINEAEDTDQDHFFKSRRQLFVFSHDFVVLPHYDVPLLFKVSDDQVSVLVVEFFTAGNLMIFKSKQVTELGFFLLDAIFSLQNHLGSLLYMILDNMNSQEDGQGTEVSHVFLMSAETILFLSATMLVVK